MCLLLSSSIFSKVSCHFDSVPLCSSQSKEAPLVGNVAPDFEAEAVFDQEFVKVRYILENIFVF